MCGVAPAVPPESSTGTRSPVPGAAGTPSKTCRTTTTMTTSDNDNNDDNEEKKEKVMLGSTVAIDEQSQQCDREKNNIYGYMYIVIGLR